MFYIIFRLTLDSHSLWHSLTFPSYRIIFHRISIKHIKCDQILLRIFNVSSLRYFYNLSFVVFVLHNFSPNVCIEFGCLKQLSRRKSVEKLREKRGYLCSFFSAYVFSECWRTICRPKGIKKLPSWALLHLAENPKCGRIMCSFLVRMYSAQIFSLSMTDYLFRSASGFLFLTAVCQPFAFQI